MQCFHLRLGFAEVNAYFCPMWVCSCLDPMLLDFEQRIVRVTTGPCIVQTLSKLLLQMHPIDVAVGTLYLIVCNIKIIVRNIGAKPIMKGN